MDNKNDYKKNINIIKFIFCNISEQIVISVTLFLTRQIILNINFIIFCCKFKVLENLIDGLKNIIIIKS